MSILHKNSFSDTYFYSELNKAVFGDEKTDPTFEIYQGMLKVNCDIPVYKSIFLNIEFLRDLGYKGIIYNNQSKGMLCIYNRGYIGDGFNLINNGDNIAYLCGVKENELRGEVILKNIRIQPSNNIFMYFDPLGNLRDPKKVISDIKNLFGQVTYLNMQDNVVLMVDIIDYCNDKYITENEDLLNVFKSHFKDYKILNLVDRNKQITFDFLNDKINYVHI